jgi:hypothetical protein
MLRQSPLCAWAPHDILQWSGAGGVLSTPKENAAGTPLIENRVGPIAGPKAVKNVKITCNRLHSTPQSSEV